MTEPKGKIDYKLMTFDFVCDPVVKGATIRAIYGRPTPLQDLVEQVWAEDPPPADEEE